MRAIHTLAAGLLCLAVPAQAEPITIVGRTSLTFDWTPAVGPTPAVGYDVRIKYMDGTAGDFVAVVDPIATLTPRPGIPFKVDVRACRQVDIDLSVCDGVWGEEAFEIRLCPLGEKGDVDCNLAVGMSDFGIVMMHYGENIDTPEPPVVEDE